MGSYNKRKKLLEERYGRLVNFKPYNDDDKGIVDNKQHKFVKQHQYITGEEGFLKKNMKQNMIYINIIAHYL